jgi:hypothetical protein
MGKQASAVLENLLEPPGHNQARAVVMQVTDLPDGGTIRGDEPALEESDHAV